MVIRVCRWCVNDLLCRTFDVISFDDADVYIDGDCPYFDARQQKERDEVLKKGATPGRARSKRLFK